MKKLIMTLMFLSPFMASNTYAYDWDKCRRSLNKQSKNAGLYGGVLTTTIFPSQFSSSWGACSALGKPEVDKKAFFNDNFEMLKQDIAKGNGEYLDAFLVFYNCSILGREEFIKSSRNNYKNIFGTNRRLTLSETIHPETRSSEERYVRPEESYNRLNKILEVSQTIISECKKIEK
ncbi:MAG: DUF3015 family protein [Bacteriovorax sp.]|jgi:hypothetical protein